MARVHWTAGILLVLFQALFGVAVARAQVDPTPDESSVGDPVSLTIVEARRLALERNPAFLAERQEAEIARGQLRQARTYNFNPELEFEAPGAASDRAFGEYEAHLTQEVEWAGQRGLRIDAAQVGVTMAEAGVRDAERRILADISKAFYAALAAERRLQIAREIERLNDQLLEATRTQLREGEISAMDANLVEIEAARSRARVLSAEREQTSARLELQRLTGLAPTRPIRLVEEEAPAPFAALNQDSLIALALERRPDLAARKQGLEQSKALRRLATREAIPNLSISGFVEREALDVIGSASPEAVRYESPRVGVSIEFPFPLWNRNQGLAAEREAQVEQATFAARAAELAVRTEVMDAYNAYQSAREEAQIFERDVLGPARENQQLLERAFRAGKLGLPTLVLLRNQLLDAELGHIDAVLAARRATIELQAAAGSLQLTDSELTPPSARDR